ncbi:MAG: serine/threonine-protein kinase [Myxococcota bacterium]
MKPGSRVHEYEVWGRIGGGGMSDVYLARHLHLSMPVIVKTLKPTVDASPAERAERMRTEALLTARIRSPRIVRPLDVGVEGDTPYLVQDYVDGVDLAELDQARRRGLGLGLPLWFVAEVVAEVAQGLGAAHRTGVLHRDLKPSNLFLSPEEGVKLGDFGVAMARRAGADERVELAGTLEYMAPETLARGEFHRATDVYGLGATAFHLRYGRPPYGSMQDVLDPRTPPSFPVPETPEEAYFQQAVGQMLEQRAEKRWSDMATVAHAFRRLTTLVRRKVKAAQEPDGSIMVDGVALRCRVGDIAKAEADGVVSSSNAEFRMDVGVGASLKQVGGDEIEREAQAGGGKPLGSCISTGAGKLKVRRVLHAVSAWAEVSCVARATQRAFLIAEGEELKTLAIPAIGTGAAKVSLEASAASMAAALKLHLQLGGSRLRALDFVLYDEAKRRTFAEVLESVFLGDVVRDDVGLADDASVPDSAATVVRRTLS